MNETVKICYGCMKKIVSGKACSCGWQYDYSQEEQEQLLPPGTFLNRGMYQIGRRLGQGGFGVTYLGRQQDELGMKVTIKEFFPRKLTYRQNAVSRELKPLYRSHMTHQDRLHVTERFESGRRGFIEEAKRLLEFNELPSIVSVLGYFEENNTAYIVMEYIDGIDLYRYMKIRGRTLSLTETKRFLLPVMEDLHKVHQAGVIHRDISPDNIMITQSGRVKLIDFGASVTHEAEEQVHVLRKNGFAPLEQYDASGTELGPWTDVYAICATAYLLLSGKMLQDARDRQYFDHYQSLRNLGIRVPASMDALLKKGTALEIRKRYQDMQALAGGLRRVRDDQGKRSWIAAGGILLLEGALLLAGGLSRDRGSLSVWSGSIASETVSRLQSDAQAEERELIESAANYAVYEDLVYIRYVFDDGTIMLMRSPVGTDDIQQVEYVTDGDLGQFCVYRGYLYLTLQSDGCLYRTDISRIRDTEDDRQRIESWQEQGVLEKLSQTPIDAGHSFVIAEDNIFAITAGEASGEYEMMKISLDGSECYQTGLHMQMTQCTLKNEYLYFTSKEGQETVLRRMRLDGCYYQELARYAGDISAMVVCGEEIYYLLNGSQGQESYLGCIGTDGLDDRKLSVMDHEDMAYCYMTGIVDNTNIYYTCSASGRELLNNLYCYSLETGTNKQISSECGRYIVTSDEIDCIIFASADGSEIRQMNKDGSNPRVMREADGSTGVLEKVDITSLGIIEDHVYYLDGMNVAYKMIGEESF